MSKPIKPCTHPSTIQVGTDTIIEVWCADCNEVIKTGKPIKKDEYGITY